MSKLITIALALGLGGCTVAKVNTDGGRDGQSDVYVLDTTFTRRTALDEARFTDEQALAVATKHCAKWNYRPQVLYKHAASTSELVVTFRCVP